MKTPDSDDDEVEDDGDEEDFDGISCPTLAVSL